MWSGSHVLIVVINSEFSSRAGEQGNVLWVRRGTDMGSAGERAAPGGWQELLLAPLVMPWFCQGRWDMLWS